jgi:tetratricopeptide (TPR) repeat protein
VFNILRVLRCADGATPSPTAFGLGVRLFALTLVALCLCVCRPSGDGAAAGGDTGGALEQARALLDQGQLDAALAKSLDPSVDGPEALCLQGQIWAKKAESAPLPSAAPGDMQPPEFKPEELRAIDLFERARAARPALSQAHLGLASLLAPHAVRRFELTRAGRRPTAARTAPAADAQPGSADLPEFGIARVVALYQQAVKTETAGTVAVDELQRFALRVKDKEVASWAHAEGIARDRESPNRLILFGDFLAKERADRHGAIDHYRQALIWRPDDTDTKNKLATLYVELGREHLAQQQWGAAQMMFDEARKYVSKMKSPQGVQVQVGLNELAAIRPREER